MQVLTKKVLRDYALRHLDVSDELLQWFAKAEAADWANGAAVKQQFPDVDYVGGDRFVFNLRRNRYRLVVRIFFPARQVYIRFIGIHADYDRITSITTI